MTLLINDEPYHIQEAQNVAELVVELGLPGPSLLIEHNAIALRREEWSTQTIAEGDRLEIIRIVAGG